MERSCCSTIFETGFFLQTGSKESTAASRLIPHFRLLGTCISSQSKGDLGDIDALLV